MSDDKPILVIWCLVALLVLISVTNARAADEVLDSVMYQSPVLVEARQVATFPTGLTTLWLKALARPEADDERQAALSIAAAYSLGMKGLESTVGPLAKTLERPDLDRGVQQAVVRALIIMDARQTARQLFRMTQSGDSDLRDLIEPALARWDYRPARTAWLQRLDQTEPLRGNLLLAIRGLADLREQSAIPRLRELTISRRTPAPVRLAAARALGDLSPSGSEQDARSLAADGPPHGLVSHLAATALLRHHAGSEAIHLLQQLAVDAEPAVSAVALERLIEIDSKLVLPVLPQALLNPDLQVQLEVLEVFSRLPTDEHIVLLGDKLDHPHPEVRAEARRRLLQLAARPEKHADVSRQGMRLLAMAGWRGQEQAALLLALMDHKIASGRLLELLRSPRSEVAVAAAWALRRLAVQTSQPTVLEYVQDWHKRAVPLKHKGFPTPEVDQQLSHLIQFLGQSRYRPAHALLWQLLPRYIDSGNPSGPETRAATAWALGLLNENAPEPRVIQALEERLKDVGSEAPTIGGRTAEDRRVRRMSAVSLGRVKARKTLDTLRRFYTAGRPYFEPVNIACGWAIEQITGEKMSPPGTLEFSMRRWFLTPILAP